MQRQTPPGTTSPMFQMESSYIKPLACKPNHPETLPPGQTIFIANLRRFNDLDLVLLGTRGVS